ncbi:MAG: bifunctional N(6)-L-threonylcarbamoyladenine synthase/serine/threonine protein kinase [Candidatus Diapherotrites archaeon]|nr:bifunctional N(6)-L-threonylcarbamoyladenine synthase/serine/threonine protein kinase [Candidatus Diapherotrites archaeon]
MKCFAIESTAHTFGAAVVDEKCNILSNEKSVYTTEKGGMIPRELAEHHYKCAPKVVAGALEKANCKMSEIDLVAFSQGPGIGNALKCGAIAARQLSLLHNIPLIGVNHCVAHVEIGRKLCGAKDPVLLYASGANTQIICFENSYYRVFGETLDVGIGNFLDSFGRELGLGFPAGPALDKMYFEGKKYIELPYTVKGMDLAFSGLFTAAKNKIGKVRKEDLVYSALHNAFAMLTEVTERALAHTEKKEVILGGGVGCSRALQEMISKMCEERGAKLFVPPNSVMVDNAAQIGWTGILMYKHGNKTKIGDSIILPKQRTDDVKVNWRK